MTTSRTGETTNFSGMNNEASINSRSTESGEAYSYTPDFDKWHGYYREIPELRAVINKFGSWTFGRGIKANKQNKAKLDKIKGFGKDSARSVLKNAWRTAMICGDSFSHIIKDNQGRITNLKPLNPQKTAIQVNNEGILTGYKLEGTDRIFEPDEIYHLSYERIADEIHGIPFPEALESLIKARNQAIIDLDILYHRNIKPIQFFEVETDDTTKLAAIETTINTAYKKSENVIIPTGVIKEIKKSSTGQYATLDSLPYIKFLVREFVTGCGMPEVIMGWGENTTEASSKVIYLAFQQEIEDMQQYNQEQILNQLGIEIDLEFPADILENVLKDERKDGQNNFKKSDSMIKL
jgi:hypothetical protein